MEKLVFQGTCKETGETINGSLIQFEDGTHTIMFEEKDDKGLSSPVYPDSVYCLNPEVINRLK